MPKLDKRNVGEPPTKPWFDNDIEHLLLLKFAMTYPNTPDCGKVTVASFVASRMTAAPFSIFGSEREFVETQSESGFP